MKRHVQNIILITNNDLCISCGACKHACPYNEIEIEINKTKGFLEPIVRNPTSCIDCETQPCLKVCPSYEEDFIELGNWTDPYQMIGPWHSLYTCYSTSPDIRSRASSGGIIRELSRYYLTNGIVDGVITLRHVQGLEYEPDLYTSVDDILVNSPGSIYHNIGFEKAIEILKSTSGRFLLIALPCQLTAIRKWQITCPEQPIGQIEISIGVICGWMFSRHSLQHFSKAMGISFADLQDVTYRGGDKVGNLVLKTLNQSKSFSRRPNYFTDSHMAQFRVAFSRTYNSKRCLLCVEHLNYLADVSVGDAWLDAFKDDKVGTSVVIVRNPKIDVTLQELEALGRIEIAPAVEADIIESQSADFAFGISAQKIINKLKSQNRFVPIYKLPNPETGLPTWSEWYKNYLSPLFFRQITWRGGGYAWFLIRVYIFHVRFGLSLPLRLVRHIKRLLYKMQEKVEDET